MVQSWAHFDQIFIIVRYIAILILCGCVSSGDLFLGKGFKKEIKCAKYANLCRITPDMFPSLRSAEEERKDGEVKFHQGGDF